MKEHKYSDVVICSKIESARVADVTTKTGEKCDLLESKQGVMIGTIVCPLVSHKGEGTDAKVVKSGVQGFDRGKGLMIEVQE